MKKKFERHRSLRAGEAVYPAAAGAAAPGGIALRTRTMNSVTDARVREHC